MKLGKHVGLTALVAAVVLGLPATPAVAQKCTLGVDIGRTVDRPPPECEIFGLGGAAGAPARGGDGAAWTVIGDQLVRQLDGKSSRVPLDKSLGNSVKVGSSPDGAAVIGSRFVQIVGGGASRVVGLPSPPVGAPAAFGQVVAVPTRGGIALVTADPNAKPTLVDTPNVDPTDDAVASGDTVWWLSGKDVGRLRNGAVDRITAPSGTPVAISLGNTSEDGVWVATAGPNEIVHITNGGAADKRYALPGPPRGVSRGEGHGTVWVSTGGTNKVIRIATRAAAGGYQPGFTCDRKIPAQCQHLIPATADGFQTIFDPPSAPTGLALGSDGRVYTGTATGLFSVKTSRPMLACERRGIEIGGANGFYTCKDGSNWQGFVNGKAAFVRISCLRYQFRFCGGTATLRYKGKAVGRAGFVTRSYDNPKLRIPVPRSFYKQITAARRRQLIVSVELRSLDGGGIERVYTKNILLYPGGADRPGSF